MKVMISQPMKEKTNEQIRIEREELVKELEKQGYEIVDTIINDFIEGEGDNYAIRCLAKSIEFIANVEGIVFMPGWENARGCKIEYFVAKNYGKFIKEAN